MGQLPLALVLEGRGEFTTAAGQILACENPGPLVLCSRQDTRRGAQAKGGPLR